MKYNLETVILCTTLAILIHCVSTYKILLYPSNAKSHFMYFGEVANALVEAKHEVHILMPSNVKQPSRLSPNVKVLVYNVSRSEPVYQSDEMKDIQIKALTSNSFEYMFTLSKFMRLTLDSQHLECEELMSNTAIYEYLAKAMYDITVMDPADHVCSPALAYKLELPIVLISAPLLQWFYRLPYFPSISTGSLIESTNDMTFLQRFSNLFADLAALATLNYSTHFIDKFVPEKDSVPAIELYRNASLWFYLHDHVTHYPMPNMPSVIDLGDLMQRPGYPLTTEFERIMSNAHKVILVAFGSIVKHIPDNWISNLCKAFWLIDSNITVIWKMEETVVCKLPANVVVKQWIPQNDLLAHKNLKLFITHCGWNSYVESAYHSKPMIAFPLWLDQPHNALAMESKGLGIKMDIRQFAPEELAGNISYVLNNETFYSSAKKLGQKIRHRDFPAKQKVVFWIEHVIMFGQTHLQTGGKSLSLFQFLMLDILAFVFVILFVLIIVFLFLCLLSIKFVKTKFNLRKTKKQKQS